MRQCQFEMSFAAGGEFTPHTAVSMDDMSWLSVTSFGELQYPYPAQVSDPYPASVAYSHPQGSPWGEALPPLISNQGESGFGIPPRHLAANADPETHVRCLEQEALWSGLSNDDVIRFPAVQDLGGSQSGGAPEKAARAIPGQEGGEDQSGSAQGEGESGSVPEAGETASGETASGAGAKSLSYIAVIATAVLSAPGGRMLLAEIYRWVQDNMPSYKARDRSWRNSIRHNLSLNECFIKVGRSDSGKSNYWAIHPACAESFSRGDFRRRRARRLVRKYNEECEGRTAPGGLLTQNEAFVVDLPALNSAMTSYVPMTSTVASGLALAAIFGAENILTREEMEQAGLTGPGGSHVTSDVTGRPIKPDLSSSSQQDKPDIQFQTATREAHESDNGHVPFSW